MRHANRPSCLAAWRSRFLVRPEFDVSRESQVGAVHPGNWQWNLKMPSHSSHNILTNLSSTSIAAGSGCNDGGGSGGGGGCGVCTVSCALSKCCVYSRLVHNHQYHEFDWCHSHNHPQVVANQCRLQIAVAANALEGRLPLRLNLQAIQGKHMCPHGQV